MKVLIVGKRPPLQGGTALDTWKFARDMVSRGHEVVFLSNVHDAANNYRMWFDEEDLSEFARLSSGIKYIDPSILNRGSFIPFTAASETLMFGAGLKDAEEADVIVGWYMQPFGFVASLLSKTFNKPLYLVHAGSDLGRLSKHEDLNNAYKWAISNGVLITPNNNIQNIIFDTFENLSPRNVKVVSRGRKLESWHNRKGSFFDFEKNSEQLNVWYEEFPKVRKLLSTLGRSKPKIAPSTTVISIYGKVGDSKGTYSLLNAFGQLINDGLDSVLCLTLAGHMGQVIKVLEYLSANPLIAERVILIPFVAPWKISSLIRSSNIICFLEHDFEVKFHSPSIPKEVLNIGTCLLCSEEVWKKYSKFMCLKDHVHMHVIKNPLDSTSLYERLRNIIDRNEVERIGIAGLGASLAHNSQISDESLLCEIVESA